MFRIEYDHTFVFKCSTQRERPDLIGQHWREDRRSMPVVSVNIRMLSVLNTVLNCLLHYLNAGLRHV